MGWWKQSIAHCRHPLAFFIARIPLHLQADCGVSRSSASWACVSLDASVRNAANRIRMHRTSLIDATTGVPYLGRIASKSTLEYVFRICSTNERYIVGAIGRSWSGQR